MPALLILPFYIGKELYSYYGGAGSNVAFMAHAGGFVAGAALLLGSYLLKPDIVNEEYIEEDQGVDPRQEQLEKIYGYMGKFQFTSAFKAIEEYVDQYGENFDLLYLKYKISRISGESVCMSDVKSILEADASDEKKLNKMEEVWFENKSQLPLDDEDVIRLGMKLSFLPDLAGAEKIFRYLHDKKCRHTSFAEFSQRLSMLFQKNGIPKKGAAYEKFAEALRLRNA